MNSLADYGTSSGEDSGDEREPQAGCSNQDRLHLQSKGSKDLSAKVVALASSAPDVAPNESLDTRRHIKPGTKEIKYNPKYEDLYAPEVGPRNPFKTEQQSAPKNSLTGLVEPAHVNDFQFELQRKTFTSFGFAVDPSMGGPDEGQRIVQAEGEEDAVEKAGGRTVFETNKVRPKDKRKRETNTDASDIEGFLGPWGKFEDEKTSAEPTAEDKEYLDEYMAKLKKRAKKQTDDKPIEEKSTLHLKEAYDYQGRSFLHIPQDVGVNLKSVEPPAKCFIPKRQIHTWQGHTKGVACMKWFPRSAHLLLSGGMDSKIKLWEVYKDRRCVRTFLGHKQAVTDVDFSFNGDKFLSTSYDRFVKLWDTETGACLQRFQHKKVGHCVKFHPDEDKQNFFLVGTSHKLILQWDIRSNEIVQEYDRHMGAVNSITFCDENRRFVTTSDDKSMRVWEWDIPVDMKYIHDPAMHSLPAVTKSPNEKWLACQSLDNKVVIYTCGDKFKANKKKEFKGHMVAGYACKTSFSPEMSYLASGDGDGRVYIWDWKTTRMLAKWKAHDRTCISVLWHPHETSKLATAGWDGVIKYWD